MANWGLLHASVIEEIIQLAREGFIVLIHASILMSRRYSTVKLILHFLKIPNLEMLPNEIFYWLIYCQVNWLKVVSTISQNHQHLNTFGMQQLLKFFCFLCFENVKYVLSGLAGTVVTSTHLVLSWITILFKYWIIDTLFDHAFSTLLK